MNRVTFLKRRARKIGWLLTDGQLATMVFLRLWKTIAASRSKEIVNQYRVRPNPDAHHRTLRISSINSCECHELLGRLQPKVVLLVGCRLLTKQTLATISCPVMNYHAGITPTYRGMNGGYFALASGDIGNFGATVHLVDDGVDTGAVLYQVRTEPNATDNISTYPMLLAAVSREICIAAVGDALNQCLRPVTVDLPSRQWFHPPIWS
ncbi:Formyl transferase (fragment) [Bosea sp. 62]